MLEFAYDNIIIGNYYNDKKIMSDHIIFNTSRYNRGVY